MLIIRVSLVYLGLLGLGVNSFNPYDFIIVILSFWNLLNAVLYDIGACFIRNCIIWSIPIVFRLFRLALIICISWSGTVLASSARNCVLFSPMYSSR